MTKVFIDGSQGTTGLRIFDRLSAREDIELITLPEELRKDLDARTNAINSSDITFLCLPDAAAIEAVSHANENVRILDTSTAHLYCGQWKYRGFWALHPQQGPQLRWPPHRADTEILRRHCGWPLSGKRDLFLVIPAAGSDGCLLSDPAGRRSADRWCLRCRQ